MPFVVTFFRLSLNHEPFTQVVQATGLNGGVPVRFDKARPVIYQVVAVQVQAVGAVNQGAIPVGQSLTGLHRQALGRRHHRRLTMVVDDAPAHGDSVPHQRRRVVQGIDVQRHAVRFNTPGVLQRPGRQLQRFAYQRRRISDTGRIEHQIARQQPVRQVGKGAAQGERHRAVTTDRFAGLMGVVLLCGQRQRLQPQQGTVLIIQGTRMQGKLP